MARQWSPLIPDIQQKADLNILFSSNNTGARWSGVKDE